MRILLFDMDGVLLEPHAYHRALVDTVSHVGRILGYGDIIINGTEITAFEAAGVSSEWDSAAICAALLLENLWREFPWATLPEASLARVLPEHGVAPPAFRPFIDSLSRADLRELSPLIRAERLLLEGHCPRTPTQRQSVQEILRKARQIDGSLTHRIFQELVLGSREFALTYALPSLMDIASYLREYDLPALPAHAQLRLIRWLQKDDHWASIFTSRPSRPVGGQFCTPEAEIGAESVGLENLPVIGLGGLSWLSAHRDCDPDAFRKPAPVHALAAMRVVLSGDVQEALEAAAALVLDGRADRGWNDLSGAEIYTFEDTVGGMQSARAARELLDRHGVKVELSLFGITDSDAKRQALEATGATVLSSLAVALDQLPSF
jgi:hypothetical protein